MPFLRDGRRICRRQRRTPQLRREAENLSCGGLSGGFRSLEQTRLCKSKPKSLLISVPFLKVKSGVLRPDYRAITPEFIAKFRDLCQSSTH